MTFFEVLFFWVNVALGQAIGLGLAWATGLKPFYGAILGLISTVLWIAYLVKRDRDRKP
jgi:hypothetical protein